MIKLFEKKIYSWMFKQATENMARMKILERSWSLNSLTLALQIPDASSSPSTLAECAYRNAHLIWRSGNLQQVQNDHHPTCWPLPCVWHEWTWVRRGQGRDKLVRPFIWVLLLPPRSYTKVCAQFFSLHISSAWKGLWIADQIVCGKQICSAARV